ncbi:MAG: signal peptidase II [Clostridiales bacterium]|nr:signal peptidase II [Clostridiales bacterium]
MSDNRKKYTILFTVLAAALVALDQITKYMVTVSFEIWEQRDLIKGFLSLYYVRNTGSAFSFLADKSWGIHVLTWISLVMGIAIYYVMLKAVKVSNVLLSTALMLLFAGAVGNLIDRAVYRSVVDFIRFDFGSYTFPIFNVADICAVVGTGLVIFALIFKNKNSDAVWEEVFHGRKA